MDPLSVASGVAGLVTLADVVISRTYNTIIACKHASEDSRKLLREVQALVGVLQSLSSLESKLGSAALQSHIPATQVLSCQQTLQNIRDKLEKSDPKENGISIFQKAKRTLKWPLSASDTDKFLAEMERHKSTFDLALSVDALDAILASQQAAEKTDTKIDDVVQALDRLCKIENTKEQRKILQMIGAEDADEAYRANMKLHQHGTGLWFLEEGKPFSTWLATPCSKLWVYGIPGAGKTILSALAIGKAVELASTAHGVAFYYCSHRDEQSRQLSGVLKCLIGQLARQNGQCMTLLEGKFGPQDHTASQTWTRNDEELGLILRKMIRRFTSVSILIDGVDECHEATTVTDALASLTSDTPSVRLVIFSRKETVMEPFLGDFVQVSIAAESQDLRLYVPAQIESRTRLRRLRIKDPNVKDEIIATLVNKADGMFRWVACQLDHLCDLTTDDERLRALEELPRTLESTYDRILERANDRGESACVLLQRCLIWIVHRTADRLSMNQLCEAVSIDMFSSSLDPRKLVDVEEILINCSSLIRLSAAGDRMESAHFTVEEYLRAIDPDRKPHLARFRLLDADAESYKAATCLTALLFNNVVDDVRKDCASLLFWLRQFPFYFHAAQFWPSYLGQYIATDTIKTLTTKLFCTPDKSNFDVWWHVRLMSWDMEFINDVRLFISTVEQSLSSVQNSASCGSQSLAGKPDWIDQFCNRQSYNWMRALSVAASSTKLHICAMFHQDHLITSLSGVATSLNASSVLGTPLHCALVGPGLLYHAMGGDRLQTFRNVIGSNKPAMATVTTLLGLGADVPVIFPDYDETSTALIAYWAGYLEDVIAAGAILGRDAINAIREDVLEMIEDSRAEDADVAVPLKHLQFLCTIDVHELSESDQPAAIELLSLLGQTPERTIDVSTIQSFFMPDDEHRLRPEYENALLDACTDDDPAFFLWILKHSGIPVDYEIGGRTLLHEVCSSSSALLAEYLISQGADVNWTDTTHSTPLDSLLRDTQLEKSTVTVTKLLLEAGASVDSLDGRNSNCLMAWARCHGTLTPDQVLKDILELILSTQCNFSQRSNDGRNVWHVLAANKFGLPLVEMLKDFGISNQEIRASVNVADDEGWTPLHVAASKGHGDMMKALIGIGSDLTPRTSTGKTILHLATAALRESFIPFEIVINADWDDAARKADGPAALVDWATACCRDHERHPTDMAKHLGNVMTELSTFGSTDSDFEAARAACVDLMAHGFAKCNDHDPTFCHACNARNECFGVLLRGVDGERTLSANDLASLTTLCNALLSWLEYDARRGKSVLSTAICVMLGCKIQMDDLERSLKGCLLVDVAISAGDEDLLGAVLALGIDVDKTGYCRDGLTIVQRLCESLAPEAATKIAVSHTKQPQGRSTAGETLLHLSIRRGTNAVLEREVAREAVVRLLIEAGVDINAKALFDGRTALMLSVYHSTPFLVDLLLENGADSSLRDYNNWDALLWASASRRADSVRSLLSLNKPFVYGVTTLHGYRQHMRFTIGPLQAATLSRSTEVLELLHGFAEVNKDAEADPKVPSSLWLACNWLSDLQMFRYLLDKDSDVHYRFPGDGTTPLHVASAVGSVEAIRALLKAGSDPFIKDHIGLTAQMYAMTRGHRDAAEVLRDAEAKPSANCQMQVQKNQLERFCKQNTLPDSMISVILGEDLDSLKNYISVDEDLALQFHSCTCTPITVALREGRAAIVEFLLDRGITMDVMTCATHIPHGCSALGLLASRDAMFGLFQTTLSLVVALPTHDFDHMMHSAVANANLQALKFMLAEKKRIRLVNSRRHRQIPVYRFADNPGQPPPVMWTNGTALHTAVQLDQYESCQVLLEHGFDPDTLNSSGVPSSHLAVHHGHDKILELLLSHGGTVEARDAALLTTLGAAVMTGNMTALELLLSRGADVFIRDYRGQSLFQTASSSRKSAVFFALLDAGLEPSLEDIRARYFASNRQPTWWVRDHLERFAITPEFLLSTDETSVKSVLNLVPPHYRKLNLTCRVTDAQYTALYRASILGGVKAVVLFVNAGAMVNLEGGREGTPLMGACKAGRLEVVKYLVRNGALLNYEKSGVQVSAFLKAKSYPKIQRWLLVERFTEQRMILDGATAGEQAAGLKDEDAWTDEIADVTLDLVLEDEVERYLESKNWFLPMRRFVDDGRGAFVRVPIMREEFARCRPGDFMVSRT